MSSEPGRAAPPLPRACRQCQSPSAALPELAMAFQPIVNVRTREVYAYEALVRSSDGQDAAWVFERISAEQRYHFDQACRVTAIRAAARLGLPARLSINIMPNAVYEPHTCIQATLRAAREVNFPLDRLLFEITEHEAVLDAGHVRHIIDTYRAYGFTTALDDYGAGHAGAGLLLALRPDAVKIDMGVIRNLHQDHWRAALIGHLAQFSAEVGMLVIAEGVETVDEARALLACGITYMQGYYFARPGFEALPEVPEDVFTACHSIPGQNV